LCIELVTGLVMYLIIYLFPELVTDSEIDFVTDLHTYFVPVLIKGLVGDLALRLYVKWFGDLVHG